MTNRIISVLKSIITTILLILANSGVVIGMTYIVNDFNIGNWYNSIFIVLGVTLANSILWPIFRRIAMKFMILTFGVGALIINSIIFYIVCYFIPEVSMGIYGFLEVPIIMAIATTFVTNITNTNYYDRYIKSI